MCHSFGTQGHFAGLPDTRCRVSDGDRWRGDDRGQISAGDGGKPRGTARDRGATAAARSNTTATAKTKVSEKTGQRRPAASEVECAA